MSFKFAALVVHTIQYSGRHRHSLGTARSSRVSYCIIIIMIIPRWFAARKGKLHCNNVHAL